LRILDFAVWHGGISFAPFGPHGPAITRAVKLKLKLKLKKGDRMKQSKQYVALGLLVSTLGLNACSPAFWGGAAAGVLGTGAGYEIQAKRQMDKLDEDLRNEKISRREYEQRKQQIESGSIIY
jgi:hypothetical protein